MTDPMKREIERAIHDAEHPSGMSTHDGMARISAATLRRLHEKCEALTADTIEEMGRIVEIGRLTRQRDALLDALKYHQEQTRPIQRTIDVIKAVEEGE